MAERLPVKQEVVGSIPAIPAKEIYMELEKLKYCWLRWPAILSLVVVTLTGLGILYLYFFDMEFIIKFFGTNAGRVPFTKIFFAVIGGVFTFFGIFFGIDHYRNGITYIQKGKIPFNELDQFIEYDNGLLLVLGSWAKLLTYGYNKILKRGYVKLLNEYDHNKKLKNWIISIN